MTRLMTYNIHAGVGRDGVCDIGRAAALIDHAGPDVVALQEVSARPRGSADDDQFRALAEATGMTALPGRTLVEGGFGYGNLLLTRRPVLDWRRIDLSRPPLERRGAIVARLDAGWARPLTVIATHLGLSPRERRWQLDRLAEQVARAAPQGPVAVLGDLNLWAIDLPALLRLRRRTGLPAPWWGNRATFPAVLPVLALDRIWTVPGRLRRRPRRLGGRLARLASDHRPLIAEIDPPAG
ncbi:endonuclease/exonuclease/phosphatase family protein [Roseospirillum parvum]|uniref:Metal-dependent hydrolase, endonuclease/exonuclease/phosphatase family n=1 Tax=Roseospirillum parvum TaxID=83401 RepID=A0A1G8CLF3_9PROT|nr:endonuclease/exonuclease/phosphatase family protein [Roseospirillum parvum]SDH46235.1 Metal-dependent hydrolase, endonuclease/exonuclease/phosphatase family [Roseospirillum parvum]